MSRATPTPEEILAQVVAALETLADGAVAGDCVSDIEQLAPIPEDPHPRREFVVHLRTEDPARVLQPFVRGWLARHFRHDAATPPIRVYLDAGSDPSLGEPEPLYRVLPVEDPTVQELLARDPSRARQYQEYRPRAVLLAGNTISGPSVAMMQALSRLLEERLPAACLDGCAGSATLALVSLRAGVPRVTSVDTAEFSSLRDIMRDHSGRWQYAVADLLPYLARQPPDAFDLITVDPFYGDTLEVINGLSSLEHLAHARLLLNGGPNFLTSWQSRVAAALQDIFPEVSWHDVVRERVYVAGPRPCGSFASSES